VWDRKPDADSLLDGEEYNLGVDRVVTNPVAADTDGDTMPDSYEVTGACLNPVTDDALGDPDGDGLNNIYESSIGTDPCSRESLASFIAFVSALEDMPDPVKNNILRRAADASHLLCDNGNTQGGLKKLEDLVTFIGTQSGKKISQAAADVLAVYVESLVGQIEAGQDVCSSL